MTPDTTRAAADRRTIPTHTASFRAAIGTASIEGDVAVSARGLLAIAGLVSGILLSSAVIVAVATRTVPQGATSR